MKITSLRQLVAALLAMVCLQRALAIEPLNADWQDLKNEKLVLFVPATVPKAFVAFADASGQDLDRSRIISTLENQLNKMGYTVTPTPQGAMLLLVVRCLSYSQADGPRSAVSNQQRGSALSVLKDVLKHKSEKTDTVADLANNMNQQMEFALKMVVDLSVQIPDGEVVRQSPVVTYTRKATASLPPDATDFTIALIPALTSILPKIY